MQAPFTCTRRAFDRDRVTDSVMVTMTELVMVVVRAIPRNVPIREKHVHFEARTG
jgi:hypothetical protein